MTVHLVKLCVGVDSVDDLKKRIAARVRENEKAGRKKAYIHVTRMCPRRQAELLAGGSIYWVIKGTVLVRQRIIGFEQRIGSDGIERTALLLEPKLILTEAQSRRAFQGWRYLEENDAPKDLPKQRKNSPPSGLSAKLAELGLL